MWCSNLAEDNTDDSGQNCVRPTITDKASGSQTADKTSSFCSRVYRKHHTSCAAGGNVPSFSSGLRSTEKMGSWECERVTTSGMKICPPPPTVATGYLVCKHSAGKTLVHVCGFTLWYHFELWGLTGQERDKIWPVLEFQHQTASFSGLNIQIPPWW